MDNPTKIELGPEVISQIIYEGAYTQSRCYDREHKAHLRQIAELPRNQQPMSASYWMNRRPRPYIAEGVTFEQWKAVTPPKEDQP